MKNYLINATLGIFLGFLSGKFYLLFLDKVFFYKNGNVEEEFFKDNIFQYEKKLTKTKY
tara:strand:+ start:1089 stop:1265 length:177 start_codon:yes stop_codon:yes gene_type:complete